MTSPSRGLLAAFSVLAMTGPAAASPATDLLDALRSRMEETYYAPPGIDLTRVMDEASRKLTVACEGQGDACPVETGLEVARGAIAELGDRHTVIFPAPTPPPGAGPAPAAGGGPPVQRLPFGWSVRPVRGQDHLYVAWVDPDGPAGKAGVRRHDRVIAPAGVTAGLLNTGTGPVRVSIEREGRTFEVDLTPDAGRDGAMPTMTMADDIAVIHFPSGTGEGAAQAGHDFLARAEAAKVRAVVLDLRDNGGGGLQCAAMTGAFTDYKAVQRDRRGEATVMSIHADHVEMGPANGMETVLTVERPTRWSGPLAVLVNENTASCSEAMAIQIARAGRGFVIGEETYGVGNNTLRPVPLTAGWMVRMTASWTEDETGQRLPPRPPLSTEVADDPVAIGATGRDAVLEAALARLRAGA
ncbi:S41 family peptidase [Brevundimonas sp. Root1423]|uniref:S41 family peptidase n=1 Tax=Brevundimonas sp. Root1423 TaxID=1736462 RepID=UPI0006F79E15|nr:S41 family peptidase [Brevundimonas sp. Root1423]KQY91751.1 hypothetical protein ASD25_18745 [Brevundimonas sp. Root1423]